MRISTMTSFSFIMLLLSLNLAAAGRSTYHHAFLSSNALLQRQQAWKRTVTAEEVATRQLFTSPWCLGRRTTGSLMIGKASLMDAIKAPPTPNYGDTQGTYFRIGRNDRCVNLVHSPVLQNNVLVDDIYISVYAHHVGAELFLDKVSVAAGANRLVSDGKSQRLLLPISHYFCRMSLHFSPLSTYPFLSSK